MAKQDSISNVNDFMKQLLKIEGVYDKPLIDRIVYPLGDIAVDDALNGGLEAGATVAFQGPPACGKTLVALQLVSTVLAKVPDKSVLWIDSEHKISNKALDRFGLVNNSRFQLIGNNNLETALDIVYQAADSSLFSLIVLDSLDGLVSDEQEERSIHDGSKVGGYKAKTLSEWLGRLSSTGYYNDTTIVIIRQVRANPGAMFTSSEVVSGGKALDHYASTILRFGPNSKENSEEKGKLAYQGVSVNIQKTNQGGRPSSPIISRFYIGDDPDRAWGFDTLPNIVALAQEKNVITRGGAIYSAGDDLLEALGAKEEIKWRGKEALLTALRDDHELLDIVTALIMGNDPVITNTNCANDNISDASGNDNNHSNNDDAFEFSLED